MKPARNSRIFLIRPEAHAELAACIEQAEESMDDMEVGVGIDWRDEGGVRVIEAYGMMAPGSDGIPGFLDTSLLRTALVEADADPEVEAVVVDWDSPGGYVEGTQEAADALAMMGKPVVSYVSGQCCSAAYWVASASDAIIASQSADIGSVGVYVVHEDLSGMADQMGIKVDVISSGKYKGMGVAGTSLTPEQRGLIQSHVDKLASRFKASILAERPEIPAEAMEGQTFMADEALDNGMADDIGGGIDDAVEAALELV